MMSYQFASFVHAYFSEEGQNDGKLQAAFHIKFCTPKKKLKLFP